MRSSFSAALSALKAGYRVARSGWNGKGMFLYHVPAETYKAQTAAAKAHFGDVVPYQAYIAMRTVDNTVVPWLASQTDLLSDDWEILEAIEEAAPPPAPVSLYDAELRDWYKVPYLNGAIYRGRVYNDRKGRFNDGELVSTSYMLAVDGDILQTRNSRYKLVGIGAAGSP